MFVGPNAVFNEPTSNYNNDTIPRINLLRPFPQYSGVGTNGTQRGYSWYDALQTKVTKRYAKGFTASGSFTWQKELEYGVSPVNNVYNKPVNKTISSFSQPLVLAIGASYQVPAVGSNRLVRAVIRDWTIGTFFKYASGFPILVPSAQNNLQNLLFGVAAGDPVAFARGIFLHLASHWLRDIRDLLAVWMGIPAVAGVFPHLASLRRAPPPPPRIAHHRPRQFR
jgi:hypothetical protein